MRRALPALLTVLVMLVPATALAGAEYRCLVMGTMQSSCCCPAEKADAEDQASQIKRTPCCNFEQASVRSALPRTESSSPRVQEPPVVVAEVSPPALASSVAPVAVRQARGSAGPPGGSPVFVLHCSFLL